MRPFCQTKKQLNLINLQLNYQQKKTFITDCVPENHSHADSDAFDYRHSIDVSGGPQESTNHRNDFKLGKLNGPVHHKPDSPHSDAQNQLKKQSIARFELLHGKVVTSEEERRADQKQKTRVLWQLGLICGVYRVLTQSSMHFT
jgi:hypothetical protein